MLRITILAAIFAAFFLLPLRVRPPVLFKLAFGLWLLGGGVLLGVGGVRLTEAVEWSLWGWAGVAVAALIGVAKGAFILTKTSRRNIARLAKLSEPSPLYYVYNTRSWVVIAIMMALSAALALFGVDPYWRGCVNLAVGLGLLLSSLSYLKAMSKANPEL